MFDQTAITGFSGSVDRGGYGMVRQDSHSLPAKFYYEAKKRGTVDGLPQYEKVLYIEIFLVGGDTTRRIATESDKIEYARYWAAFESGKEPASVGYPLEQVPWLDVAQIATFKAMNIPNLESLAQAPDDSVQRMMGGLKYRDQARAMIEMLKGQEPMLKMTAEKEAMQSQLDLQSKQIKELCDEIEKMKSGNNGPRKKGGFTPIEE